MTRGELRVLIKTNLESAGISFYGDPEINDSIQDAYDDVAILTQCIVKSATINQAAKNYYNFKDDHAITDYLSTIAIYNSITKLWLQDDLALRQFDRIRYDWENARGNSIWWAPAAYNRIVILPFNTTPVSTFVLWYAALAPTLSSDASTFLIASDMMHLPENYATADLLETAEEFNKAEFFWKSYYADVEVYKQRCHNVAHTDLLMRV